MAEVEVPNVEQLENANPHNEMLELHAKMDDLLRELKGTREMFKLRIPQFQKDLETTRQTSSKDGDSPKPAKRSKLDTDFRKQTEELLAIVIGNYRDVVKFLDLSIAFYEQLKVWLEILGQPPQGGPEEDDPGFDGEREETLRKLSAATWKFGFDCLNIFESLEQASMSTLTGDLKTIAHAIGGWDSSDSPNPKSSHNQANAEKLFFHFWR